MVISSGQSVSTTETKNTLKRKWKEIATLTSGSSSASASSKKPLFFSDEDYLVGEPNEFIPVIISASMLGVEVKRILVDQGSSADIMFQDLLPKLGLSLADLSLYLGTDLSSLGPEQTRPLGYLDVMVTYGLKKLARTIKTTLLILPLITPYRCLADRPTLARFSDIASTIHLKMKLHSLAGKW